MKHLVIALGLIGILFTPVLAGIINVPGDQPTIQDGINTAANGDTVLVADNIYFENINFRGKKIVVASHYLINGDTSHIANTIIDGSQPSNPDSGTVVYFTSGEDTNSVLLGFTITGGTGTLQPGGMLKDAGGILCIDAGARIFFNIIRNNSLLHSGSPAGGGICAYPNIPDPASMFVIMENNRIQDNYCESTNSGAFGGGIFLQSNGRIVSNKIINNEVSYTGSASPINGSFGGGISCLGRQVFQVFIFVTIRDNIISGNRAVSSNSSGLGGYGGGLDCIRTNADLQNNVISGNLVGGNPFAYGAGMRYLLSENIGNIKQNTFSDNSPLSPATIVTGCLLLIQTEDLSIEENNFHDNNSNTGGGIFISSSTGTVIRNNRIFRNNVSVSGGGIYITNSSPLVENNLIVGNQSTIGGGVFVIATTAGKPTENNVLLLSGLFSPRELKGKTKATDINEFPLYQLNTAISEPNIINNTIVKNNAASSGGGMSITNSNPVLINSILWDNSASSNPQIQVSSGSVSVEYSDIQGGWSGAGNIDLDPVFEDTLNYYLTPSLSPAIDNGNPNSIFNDAENASNPGFACFPARGRVRNDMGTYGGPGVICDILVGIDDTPVALLPANFKLSQNYPNPFNPITHIEFLVSDIEFVELKIYNTAGQLVRTLLSETKTAGWHSVVWNGKNDAGRQVASGVYIYRLEAKPLSGSGKAFVQSRKMVLLR
jgi:hypothetical protein